MSSAGFEPAIPAVKLLQTYALQQIIMLFDPPVLRCRVSFGDILRKIDGCEMRKVIVIYVFVYVL